MTVLSIELKQQRQTVNADILIDFRSPCENDIFVL